MKKIRRMAPIVLTILLVLVGCSSSKIPKIDEYSWTMTTIQSADADGQAVAYGDNESSMLYNGILVVLECKAENGVLTLTDATNSKTYTGSYKVSDTNAESRIYDVTIANTNGIATSALTTYSDKSSNPTFIMSLGDYTLNFQADLAK